MSKVQIFGESKSINIDRIKIMEDQIAMYESLLTAILQAGGNPKWYTIKNLYDMKVTDLIYTLATNGIRFCYSKSE